MQLGRATVMEITEMLLKYCKLAQTNWEEEEEEEKVCSAGQTKPRL